MRTPADGPNAEKVAIGTEKGGPASLGGGGKESHRDSSLSTRRRQKDGTREGSKRRKRREQRAISQRQGKRMSDAGGAATNPALI